MDAELTAADQDADCAARAARARPRVASSEKALGAGSRGGAVIDVAIATLAVLLIASPMLFTSEGFAPDFTKDLWLAGYQQHAIAAYPHPTLFLQTQQSGVFYPLFAFYDATLAALAVVLGGSTVLGFEVVTLAAIAAAYGCSRPAPSRPGAWGLGVKIKGGSAVVFGPLRSRNPAARDA
jgi:hypothetical protein